MHGLMQEAELTLDRLLTHAARWHGQTPITSRSARGEITRTNYAAIARRARRVSNALRAAGIAKDDRVEFIEEMPTGPTGKIDKKKLRDKFGGTTFVRTPESREHS